MATQVAGVDDAVPLTPGPATTFTLYEREQPTLS